MTLPPGPHGGDGPRVARALGLDAREVLDLSLSLNPFAPDVEAIVGRHLAEVRRYPDLALATSALARADEHADVWDEAFYSLAAGAWTRGDPGAIVVGQIAPQHARRGAGRPHRAQNTIAKIRWIDRKTRRL